MSRVKDFLWRGKLRKAATILVGGFIVLIIIGAIASAFEEEKENGASAPPAALRSETSTPEPTKAAEPTSTPRPTATPKAAVAYEVVKREDVSFGTSVRIVYRIVVSDDLTEEELREIAQELIDQETAQQDVNAIAIFAYLPGTDTEGVYTAGQATWAPHGDWAQANEVVTGDYSEHELVVDAEPVFEPIESSVSLTEETKREIFWEAVKMENELGLFTSEVEPILAERYGISADEVGDIIIEGITKGWPAPW